VASELDQEAAQQELERLALVSDLTTKFLINKVNFIKSLEYEGN